MEPSSLSMHVTHRTCTTIKYNKVIKEVHTGFFFLFVSRFWKIIEAKSTCFEIVVLKRKKRFFLLVSEIMTTFAFQL